MSLETRIRHAEFRSRSDDGLYQVVQGAATAVMGQDLDCPGVLEIQPQAQHDRSLRWLRIEATFAEGMSERLIAQLDVRARHHASELPSGLLRDGLARFGGQAFTNLCIGREAPTSDGPGGDVLDLTVSFPSRFPFLADNLSLAGEPLSAGDRDLCRSVLVALGVRFREAQRGWRVPRWQLRRRLDLGSQLNAFEVAAKSQRRISMYSTGLPPSHSVRLERGFIRWEGAVRSYVDVCLSRGLTALHATTVQEAQSMQGLLAGHLGVEFGGRDFQVASRQWTGVPAPRSDQPE
jgi:hypothetical protein